LLNSDGLIQIDNYIYKVDPIREKVYALEAINFDETNCNNLMKCAIVFSTEDNILDIMNGKSSGEMQKTDYCRSKLMGPFDLLNGDIDYSIRYVKLGLYYSLNAKIGCDYGCGTYTVTLNSNCFWVNKNESEYDITGTDSGSGSANVRAYSSTRRLTDYRYSATFIARISGNLPNPWSDVLTIECSYN
jgi:hypothetical protein